MSWSLWYLVISITSCIPDYKLEWAYCGHSYNSKWCHSNLDDKLFCLSNNTYELDINNTIALNGTCSTTNQANLTSSVEEYWNRQVLGHVGYDWTHFVIIRVTFKIKDQEFH